MTRRTSARGGALGTRRDLLLAAGAGAAAWLGGCGDVASERPGATPGDGGAQPGAGGALGDDAAAQPGTGGAPAEDAAAQPGTGGERVEDAAAPPRDATTDAPGAICAATRPDIEGPFYREGVPIRRELDLYGEPGTRLTLSGRVLDRDCVPIAGAVVEIWHADTQGAYDRTSAELRYYGQTATSASGDYSFHTLLPARYLNGPEYRPRHVHLKAWLPEPAADGSPALRLALTTQIYFEGDPYNEGDAWWDPTRTVPLADLDGDAVGAVFDVRGIG